MAFCTECGFKLPDDAVFCPNCGASLITAPKNENVGVEAPAAPAQADFTVAPAAEVPLSEAVPVPGSFQTSGAYEAPAQASYAVPTQGTYTPPQQNSFVPPQQNSYVPSNQGAYIPPQQPAYNAPNAYGFPPQGGVAVATKPKKKLGAGAIVGIVIGGLAALALIIVLVSSLFGGSPYVGYWESVAVDVGDGIVSQDYYGTSIAGALGMQINSDGTIYLASSSDTEIIEGTWEKTDDGIIITTSDNTYSMDYDDDQLILLQEGETYYFEIIEDHDINNPTVPHGSLADTDVTDDPAVAGGIAGSGAVGYDSFYITVTGAEDFVDVDGESAIRIYYDFTNNYSDDFASAAYDVLSYYAIQDGSYLTETYSYDYDSVASNSSYNIRPGVTMQCCSEFKYDPYGGSVDFSVYSYYDDESGGVVTASYIPGSLPGAPAPYVLVPITDPQWTTNMPGEGDLDGFYVAVTDGELVSDANGDPAIRIYYQFTNNGTYTTSMSNELSPFTYQDGVSLDTTYETVDSETDMNYYADVAPGSTVTASCVYALRNQTSPVEAEVETYTLGLAVGQTYYFD